MKAPEVSATESQVCFELAMRVPVTVQPSLYVVLGLLGLFRAVLAGEPSDPLHYYHPELPQARWELAGGEVRYSGDGGATWRGILKRPGLLSIAGDPLRPQRVYFSSVQTTYVTDDAQHVRPLGGPREGGRLAVDRLGRVYVAAHLGQRPGCWRYADGAWDRLLDQPVTQVIVDAREPWRLEATFLASQGVQSWRSSDDGLNWSRGRLPGEAGNISLARRYTLRGEDADYAVNPELQPPLIVFRNGWMTQGGELPVAWNRLQGQVLAGRDSRVFHSAPASLRVASKGSQGFVSQRIAAPGPTRVRVSGLVRCEGKGEAELAIQALDDKDREIEWRTLSRFTGFSNWHMAGGEFQLPEGTAAFAIALRVRGVQVAWLDDVTLHLLLGGQWKPAARILDPESGRPGEPLDASRIAVTPAPGHFASVPRAWADWHQRLMQWPSLNTQVVFLGDDLTEQWRLHPKQWEAFAQRGAANYGISGDRTQTVLWRLNHGELDAAHPKVIVLMIGGNNLLDERQTPEAVAGGIRAVVGRLRELQPQARILLQGILPREREAQSPMRARIQAVNEAIASLADGQQIKYVDVGTRVLDANGVLSESPDGFHLTSAAYTRWAGAIWALVEEMLPARPQPARP